MSTTGFSVSVEQLLVPFGHVYLNLHVRLFEPARPVGTVICFHGFSGNGGDFDALARALALNGYLVVCPDLIGRGASGYFDDPRQYNLKNTVTAAAAVLDKFGGQKCDVVAVGWGAAIALVLLNSVRANVGRLLLCDAPLNYSPLSDPIVARAVADAGRTFATREDAARHVLASPEFAAASAGDPESVAHRVRRIDDGEFRLNFDESIVIRMADYAGRHFDLGPLLREFEGESLLLFGRSLDPAAAATVEALSAKGSRLAHIDGVTPAGPLLLRDRRELLIALGFIGARKPPFGA